MHGTKAVQNVKSIKRNKHFTRFVVFYWQ